MCKPVCTHEGLYPVGEGGGKIPFQIPPKSPAVTDSENYTYYAVGPT